MQQLGTSFQPARTRLEKTFKVSVLNMDIVKKNRRVLSFALCLAAIAVFVWILFPSESRLKADGARRIAIDIARLVEIDHKFVVEASANEPENGNILLRGIVQNEAEYETLKKFAKKHSNPMNKVVLDVRIQNTNSGPEGSR